MPTNDSEIFNRLSRIEQGVARIDERTEAMTKSHGDHENRIRALERANDRRSGALAAVGSIAGAVGAGLMWLVKFLTGSN